MSAGRRNTQCLLVDSKKATLAQYQHQVIADPREATGIAGADAPCFCISLLSLVGKQARGDKV